MSRGRTGSSKSTLELEALGAPIEVRRHPAARRLTLRVSKTKRAVVVTVPAQCRMEEAGKFVESNLDWVRERLGSVPVPIPFADGAKIPLRGCLHCLSFSGVARARPVELATTAEAMPRLLVSGRLEHASRRFKDWLLEQARADLDACVTRHGKTLGVKARSISLRDQTSRWGSCTAGGFLSFSWRLILAPAHVLDYVAAHEVAHLLEMNHGPRFWKHVARCMPRLEEAKRWLRSHGADLHRYGAG
ncbi:MAG TPA: SprT family zinc-dependent metalloprotease [Hyphomicrobiaceae bacterium]|nr:SprT family zinc-dependent metalloprotease [Hyphomicrobiaceae bacterium]